MLCGCQGKKRAQNSHNEPSLDSPLQVRLVKMLGLKNYLLDKFVFRRKSSSYCIRNIKGTPTLFNDLEKYRPPTFYTSTTHIVESHYHSVPIVRLTPMFVNLTQNLPIIIYSHGNSSDMGDSLCFITRLAQKFRAQYVVFDYTGYGESRKKEVGEEIICGDLQLVLAWLNQPLERIILWGFSLGSYPTVISAAKYKVAACILQCPIGSLSCMFYDEYAVNVKFKDDHFANIDYIGDVRCKIMIMHSLADEIIPIEQARLLYHKYVAKRGDRDMQFIQVQKIKHNSFHRYIVSQITNDLQKEVLSFLESITGVLNSPSTPKTTQASISSTDTVLFPEDLKKMRQGLVEARIQENFFDEEDFEIVQSQQAPTSRTRTSKNEWLCCGK